MRIGVVSDTHGHVPFTRDAVRMLEQLEVELVIHCGDVGSAEIVSLFSAWPTHFVLGNVDVDDSQWDAVIEAAGQKCHGRFGSLEAGGVGIAFLHGDDERRFREALDGGEWDMILYGHTHVARQSRVGRTLVLNPGAIYRANPRSIAVVELPALEATMVPLA